MTKKLGPWQLWVTPRLGWFVVPMSVAQHMNRDQTTFAYNGGYIVFRRLDPTWLSWLRLNTDAPQAKKSELAAVIKEFMPDLEKAPSVEIPDGYRLPAAWTIFE